MSHQQSRYTITEFPLPTCERCLAEGGFACVAPTGLAFGSDGNLWIGLQFGPDGRGGIARMAPDGGDFTVFSDGLPPHGSILNITLGSDGNIWFANFGQRGIGRITPQGEITQFRELTPALSRLPPSPHARSAAAEAVLLPYGIVGQPGGDIWFTTQDLFGGLVPYFTTGYVGRFSPHDPTSTLQTYPLTGVPSGVAVGPDGDVWVIHFHRWTDKSGGGLSRITTAGEVTTYPLPRPEADDPDYRDRVIAATTAELTFDHSGNIWFVHEGSPYIGRFSPRDGAFRYFKVDVKDGVHFSMLTAARDGYVYVGDSGGGRPYRLWRISPDGTLTTVATGPQTAFWTIIEGPDGNLWYSHRFSDVICRMTLS